MIHLQGKRVVVTGAASGFGAGIATACDQAGAQVGLLDLNLEGAKALAAGFNNAPLAVEVDITRSDQIERALTAFIDHAGGIDVLVNNAGMGLTPQPLETVSEADFDRLMAVNVRALFLLSQRVVPLMKEAGSGVILNIASTAGVSPRPNLTWYNASKGWVITATRSMAVELAASNIRVNALNPVAGDTPMLATFLGDDTPERRQAFIDTIPLGRLSTPQDIGEAAVFLCSDAASMITGVALEVDGGRCI